MAGGYDEAHVMDLLFVCFHAGSLLWLFGWVINLHSDHVLRNLRAPGETGYKIPRG